MSLWSGIYTLVASKSNLTAQIGTSPTRFYANRLPQGLTTFPAVRTRIVSIPGNPSFDGASSMDHNMIDFFVYGRTYKETMELSELIRSEIEDTEGTFDGLSIKGIRFVDMDDEPWQEDINRFVQNSEYKISTQ